MKKAAFVISIVALALSAFNVTLGLLTILEKKKYFDIGSSF